MRRPGPVRKGVVVGRPRWQSPGATGFGPASGVGGGDLGGRWHRNWPGLALQLYTPGGPGQVAILVDYRPPPTPLTAPLPESPDLSPLLVATFPSSRLLRTLRVLTVGTSNRG